MRGIQNVTHQEISAQQRDGSVGVPGSIPTTSPDSQIRLARARFSLNCMFVFMCWLLCLVSYNPVGADPKPCFKKNQITLYPECVLQIKSKNRSFLQIYEGLGPRATNCFRRWTHKFWLIFPSECFSLEMPPNDLSHNYTLYNTIFFITTDDSCAGQLSPFVTQAMPSSHLH